jgi:hypothetical protein
MGGVLRHVLPLPEDVYTLRDARLSSDRQRAFLMASTAPGLNHGTLPPTHFTMAVGGETGPGALLPSGDVVVASRDPRRLTSGSGAEVWRIPCGQVGAIAVANDGAIYVAGPARSTVTCGVGETAKSASTGDEDGFIARIDEVTRQ